MRSRSWRRVLVAPCAAALLGAFGAASSPAAAAAPSHPIHPGTTVTFAGVSCKAGVVLAQGSTRYLGVPASCGGLEPGKAQNGCTEAEAPLGAPVHIDGAHHRGILVYNSFTRMQAAGTTNARRCAHNDLALVRINRADRHLVSGSIPGVRAPTAVSSHGPRAGSTARLGDATATSNGSTQAGWVYQVTTSAMSGSLTTADLGEPLVQGGLVSGMLTVLPAGVVMKSPAEVYNLHRALVALRHTKGFHHVALFRAGRTG